MKQFLIVFLFLCSCKTSNLVEMPDDSILSQDVKKKFESYDGGFLDAIFKRKTKVAILLPLTGKYSDIGNDLLSAAHLSLYKNDPKKRIELVIFDSKGTEFGTRKAVRDIVSRGIKIIIGPLFSTATESAIDIVSKKDVILLSLSNNDNLTNKKNVFIAGVAIDQQIERLIEYSIDKGIGSFSILAPNNSYGLKVANSLRETSTRKGAYFISSSFYNDKKQISNSVAKVVNSYSISQNAYEDLSEEDKVKSLAEIPISNEDKIYSDSILVADSGDNLDLILKLIEENNVDKREIQILGLKEWDKASTIYNANAKGSWISSSNPEVYKQYEYLYYDNFQKIPNRVTSVVYDMVWAVANLAYKNSDIELEDFILNKSGFEGVDGTFRFLDNGIVQRNFAILSVGDDNFKVIDSESRYFLEY